VSRQSEEVEAAGGCQGENGTDDECGQHECDGIQTSSRQASGRPVPIDVERVGVGVEDQEGDRAEPGSHGRAGECESRRPGLVPAASDQRDRDRRHGGAAEREPDEAVRRRHPEQRDRGEHGHGGPAFRPSSPGSAKGCA
jgi:hypothetical protein